MAVNVTVPEHSSFWSFTALIFFFILVSARIPVALTMSSDMRDWVHPVSGKQSLVLALPWPCGVIVTFCIIGVGLEFPLEITSPARIDFILSTLSDSYTLALLACTSGESSLTILAFLSLRRASFSSRPLLLGVRSLSLPPFPPLPPFRPRVQTLA